MGPPTAEKEVLAEEGGGSVKEEATTKQLAEARRKLRWEAMGDRRRRVARAKEEARGDWEAARKGPTEEVDNCGEGWITLAEGHQWA